MQVMFKYIHTNTRQCNTEKKKEDSTGLSITMPVVLQLYSTLYNSKGMYVCVLMFLDWDRPAAIHVKGGVYVTV